MTGIIGIVPIFGAARQRTRTYAHTDAEAFYRATRDAKLAIICGEIAQALRDESWDDPEITFDKETLLLTISAVRYREKGTLRGKLQLSRHHVLDCKADVAEHVVWWFEKEFDRAVAQNA